MVLSCDGCEGMVPRQHSSGLIPGRSPSIVCSAKHSDGFSPVFTQASILKSQTIHLSIKRFTCEHGDKKLTQTSRVKTHIQAFLCGVNSSIHEHRDEKFDYASQLNRHVQAVHLKETIPYSRCNKVLGRRGSVKRHIKAIHLNNGTADPNGRRWKFQSTYLCI